MRTFKVSSQVVDLAVHTDGEAVTGIELGGSSGEPPGSTFERAVERELQDYLAGRRLEFTFPIKPEGSSFDLAVWEELGKIPYGETVTYGDVARSVGRPAAARAVGMANHRNPIPIAIPCHRVVAAGGKLGGYGGGVELKRKLLDMERRNNGPASPS